MTGIGIDLARPDPELILAGTLWGEARGSGAMAMRDVACVIVNRVRAGCWQASVPAVCLAPYQFSCWNARDPNRAKILATALADADLTWLLARSIARLALVGALTDRTMGADSYFATSIKPPAWARPPARHTATLGPHSFWRVKPPAASQPTV